MPPPGGSSNSTDSLQKKQPLTSKFKPQKALFTNFGSNASIDKENYPQTSTYYQPQLPQYDGLPQANFSLEGLYPQKPPTKRLMDAAPIHESRPFKKTKTEDIPEPEESEVKEVPAPESFPPLHDDGSKPPHSYAQLIGMAILRAPNRRLTLAQIYKWISDTYSHYSLADAGWQNSIRHNLSLNKAFVKQERPKDDPGKGNYWAIVVGMEHQFIKEKASRKAAGPNENVPVLSTKLIPFSQPETSHFKPLVPAPLELPPSSQQKYSLPEPSLPAIPEISSDATIPASDAVTDPENEDETEEAPSSPLIQSSPPTAMMNSSPPVSRHAPKRHDTPPPVPRFPTSSTSRSRKRKYSAMDDSGYFSSLDSSALRPNRLLTSEADRPRIKRGRAEEEIARLRGSSYDSPTKSRAMFVPPSSSPLRMGMSVKIESSQMLPPLTPIVKLKAPMRPPPSASPNTNLRQHRDKVREMLGGSPLRGVTCLDTDNLLPWSPAFQLDDNPSMFTDLHTDFDIFADSTAGLLSVPGNGSPEKRSAKRARFDGPRAANLLSDVSTSSRLNKNITSTPLFKFTPNVNTPKTGSPIKSFGLESPSKLLGLDSPSKFSTSLLAYDVYDYTDDFFNPEVFAEDISEGWDIMQGFQKIGSGHTLGGQSNKKSPKPASRPTMHSRSFTSRF